MLKSFENSGLNSHIMHAHINTVHGQLLADQSTAEQVFLIPLSQHREILQCSSGASVGAHGFPNFQKSGLPDRNSGLTQLSHIVTSQINELQINQTNP